MKKWNRVACIIFAMILLVGCSLEKREAEDANTSANNIIITETGETLIKDQSEENSVPTLAPEAEDVEELGELPEPEVEFDEQRVEPEIEPVIGKEDQVTSKGEDYLQIVFLGDSIFDGHRDGTGIPYLTSVACNDADCFNLAIGGTTAAITKDDQYENEAWTSISGVGITKAIMGVIPTDIFAGTRAKEIIDSGEVDFSKTDYFVVEYGMNDFLSGIPLRNEDKDYDIRTYVGALRYIVSNLREVAPDSTIVLCMPTYATFDGLGGKFYGDGNIMNTGYGTLFDYAGICQYVSKEQQTEVLNAYLDLGINGYTVEDYLEDGIHLTEAGRKLYADALAKIILRVEETKNN